MKAIMRFYVEEQSSDKAVQTVFKQIGPACSDLKLEYPSKPYWKTPTLFEVFCSASITSLTELKSRIGEGWHDNNEKEVIISDIAGGVFNVATVKWAHIDYSDNFQ